MKTIHDIIDLMRSDPRGVSLKFGIPIRTIYTWCEGVRTPPDYVIMMMLNIILLERRLGHGEGLEGRISGIGEGIKEVGQES